MFEPEPTPLTTGSHGDYQWLVTTEHSLDDVILLCPEVVLGKYLAITSMDSGTYHPDEEERAAGWEMRHRITYSPKIQNAATLHYEGYDEWYIFDSPADLGQLHDSGSTGWLLPLPDGEVRDFVNYCFDLRRPADPLTDLFWPQLERIRPLYYVADCDAFLSIVTADANLFGSLLKALDETRPST